MEQQFNAKNVPINIVAKALGKDPQYVRQALIQGYLPIGNAFKMPNSSHYTYYVSPKLLYEYTGYVYDENNTTTDFVSSSKKNNE